VGLSSEVDKFFFWEVKILDRETMFFEEESGV
jgi:hypothetical protein